MQPPCCHTARTDCLVPLCAPPRYRWQGLGDLPATLARIKVEAFDEGGAAGVGRAGERREKSLGLLSQRFIQTFLLAPPPRIISLEAAAEALMGAPICLLSCHCCFALRPVVLHRARFPSAYLPCVHFLNYHQKCAPLRTGAVAARMLQSWLLSFRISHLLPPVIPT